MGVTLLCHETCHGAPGRSHYDSDAHQLASKWSVATIQKGKYTLKHKESLGFVVTKIYVSVCVCDSVCSYIW